MTRKERRYMAHLESVLRAALEAVDPVPSVRALAWLERKLNRLARRAHRAEKFRREIYEG